ncbi:HSP90 family protein [Microbacterium halophytorum]|uniref:HSP90 family protein n=1 Tax=Microbacterium halophytorum TaxID=2067568 RepID=UPI000CFBA7C9|nr:HSP90 family protein [Microbacterium halophytorum]
MSSSTTRPFQVDLRSVVDLLGRHIYSSPQVFLRELLQNGRDAIRARGERDPDAPAGLIEITPAEGGEPFRFRDNGVGLTAAEAADLLSTVGRSSKRDELLQVRRESFLGQFGIGLLSCFMVSDRITVISRSASGAPAIEWVGDATGEFRVRELDGAETASLPIGTEVVLEPRPDERALLERARVTGLAARFGGYLPVRVAVADARGGRDTITREPAFLDRDADRPALDALGEELLGRAPLDVIPLSVPETGTSGVAFVLPFPAPPGMRQPSTVHLGRMLVSEQLDTLLPPWAFFVRAVINTEHLTPTASREAFVDDTALEVTRERLGGALRDWIVRLSENEPWRFQEFLSVHAMALKAMAVHDDELARAVLPWLTLETSSGTRTVTELAESGAEIRYVETVDEFRQVAAVAGADAPVVNAGYSYDAELLRRLPSLTGARVSRVRVGDVFAELSPPPADDADAARALARRAAAALADARTEVGVRAFEPASVPGLCVADPESMRRQEIEQAKDQASGSLWGDVLGDIGAILDERRQGERRGLGIELCLNWSSPLVRQVAQVTDEVVFDRTIKLLYVQSLLASHRPLTPADRDMLTGALGDMIALSAGVTDGWDGIDITNEGAQDA